LRRLLFRHLASVMLAPKLSQFGRELVR
jgi:hypothetical protein